MCERQSGRNAASASGPYAAPISLEKSTEFASSCSAAALNWASRPASAAPVALDARKTCSARSWFRLTRRPEAGVIVWPLNLSGNLAAVASAIGVAIIFILGLAPPHHHTHLFVFAR